jgi:predicted  nucleic acid-binding Zn-ribbon protein
MPFTRSHCLDRLPCCPCRDLLTAKLDAVSARLTVVEARSISDKGASSEELARMAASYDAEQERQLAAQAERFEARLVRKDAEIALLQGQVQALRDEAAAAAAMRAQRALHASPFRDRGARGDAAGDAAAGVWSPSAADEDLVVLSEEVEALTGTVASLQQQLSAARDRAAAQEEELAAAHAALREGRAQQSHWGASDGPPWGPPGAAPAAPRPDPFAPSNPGFWSKAPPHQGPPTSGSTEGWIGGGGADVSSGGDGGGGGRGKAGRDADLSNENKRLREQLSAAQGEAEALRSKLASDSNAVAAAQALAESRAAAVARTEEDCDGLRAKLASVEKAARAASEHAAALQSETDRLRRRAGDAEAKLADASAAADAQRADANDLRRQLTRAQGELQGAREQVQALRGEVERLQGEVESASHRQRASHEQQQPSRRMQSHSHFGDQHAAFDGGPIKGLGAGGEVVPEPMRRNPISFSGEESSRHRPPPPPAPAPPDRRDGAYEAAPVRYDPYSRDYRGEGPEAALPPRASLGGAFTAGEARRSGEGPAPFVERHGGYREEAEYEGRPSGAERPGAGRAGAMPSRDSGEYAAIDARVLTRQTDAYDHDTSAATARQLFAGAAPPGPGSRDSAPAAYSSTQPPGPQTDMAAELAAARARFYESSAQRGPGAAAATGHREASATSIYGGGGGREGQLYETHRPPAPGPGYAAAPPAGLGLPGDRERARRLAMLSEIAEQQREGQARSKAASAPLVFDAYARPPPPPFGDLPAPAATGAYGSSAGGAYGHAEPHYRRQRGGAEPAAAGPYGPASGTGSGDGGRLTSPKRGAPSGSLSSVAANATTTELESALPLSSAAARRIAEEDRERDARTRSKAEADAESRSREAHAPFATAAATTDLQRSAASKEAELVSLNQRRDAVSGDLDRLGTAAPRTLQDRRRKAELSAELGQLEKRLAEVRIWLKANAKHMG